MTKLNIMDCYYITDSIRKNDYLDANFKETLAGNIIRGLKIDKSLYFYIEISIDSNSDLSYDYQILLINEVQEKCIRL